MSSFSVPKDAELTLRKTSNDRRWLVLADNQHVATIFINPGCVLWYAPNMPPDAGRAPTRGDALDEIANHLGIEPTTRK